MKKMLYIIALSALSMAQITQLRAQPTSSPEFNNALEALDGYWLNRAGTSALTAKGNINTMSEYQKYDGFKALHKNFGHKLVDHEERLRAIESTLGIKKIRARKK